MKATVAHAELTNPPGVLSPGLLAATETFDVTIVNLPAGVPTQILVRDARRTGITINTGPAAGDAIGVLPRYPLPTEVAALGLQNGPILITLDLYRAALMAEWWAYSPSGTNITVFAFRLI